MATEVTYYGISNDSYFNNYSNYGLHPYMFKWPRSDFDKLLYELIVPICYGLITLIGAIGNALVIFVITGKNKMRSATNLLLLNLAVADLAFVLILPPFTAYQSAMETWPFGNVTCKLMHYLTNVSVYVTVYTLVLIALIRYLTIVHSQKTTRIRATPNILLMMACIWIVSFIVNIPILWIYSAHDIFEEYPEHSEIECSVISQEAGKRSFIIMFVFSYFIPLTITLIFSICILHYIRRQRPRFLTGEARTQGNNRKKQASRILIIVVALFALLWLPVHVNLVLIYSGYINSYINSNSHNLIFAICQVLAYSNSCVNPLVYNFVSKDFRDSFGDVVLCRRSSVEQIIGTNLVTRTTTAQFSPDTRHKKKKRTEMELIPLSNGHVQSHTDIQGNGVTCETEVEGADSSLDML